MGDNHVDRRIPLSPKERQPPAPLSVDKTDEIRIWALARQQQGLPTDSDDWKRAYGESEAVQ